MKNSISVIAFVMLATVGTAGAQAQTSKPSGPVGTTGVASTSRAAAADTTPDYRLTAGDKLRIEVFKDAMLSQNLQVRPDGKITLPLVGDIPAAGRTSSELRDAITRGLKESGTHENPLVTVIVVETVPPVVYVMGEVRNAGPQPLKGEMSVLQALSSAGGFTDWAKKKIRVLRKSSTGLTTTLEFDYKKAVKGAGVPLVLQPGDTVIVE